MKGVLKKWGNSFAIRIPKSIIDDLGLEVEEEIEIKVASGSINLKPLKRKRYTLDDLMQKVTMENIHEPFWTDSPRGKEAW
ncbi:MAG: AbrB/MazE/SpoVT family DNA-binding domain-containing protein [Candidatus Sigynarchaeota archaeon]